MKWTWSAVFMCTLAVSVPHAAHAAMLTYVRDTLSTSEPNLDASHAVEFTVAAAVPASGHIRIVPQAGAFVIPADFSFVDVDVAVDSGSGYADADLAATASGTEAGVAVTSGMNGSIDITLNATTGIPAHARVKVTLGLAANFGDVASSSIANPSALGSYRVTIATETAASATLDTGTTMIAIVRPVGVSFTPQALEPVRSNGSPSGILAGHTTSVELSLQTVDPASCRYSTVASTTYAAMSGAFTGWDNNRVFSANVSVQDDTSYTFYVRCKDTHNLLVNTDDYVIAFSVGATPESTTSIQGSGIVGSGGSGPYPNGSSVLFLANVILRGWSAPNSSIDVLKDGAKVGTVSAKQNGSFESQVQGLERGVYTFVLSSKDSAGHRSGTISSTITLQQGTTNTITDLIIPPTLGFVSASQDAAAHVAGFAVPNSRIELELTLKSKDPVSPQLFAATTSASGVWSIEMPGSLALGTYTAKARTVVSDTQKSDWGTTLLAVGTSAPSGGGESDMNGDGKVNLVDFSILLTTWGKAGPGDINGDGTTNLADFSIMLFNWTG